jgi:predicted RNA-binding protein with PUA-like domain
MALIRLGRLSVQPVTEREFQIVLELADKKPKG